MLVDPTQTSSKTSTFNTVTVHLVAQLITLCVGLGLVAYGAIVGSQEAVNTGGIAVAGSALIAWKP